MADDVAAQGTFVHRDCDVLVVPHQQSVAIVEFRRSHRDVGDVRLGNVGGTVSYRCLIVGIGDHKYGVEFSRRRHILIDALLLKELRDTAELSMALQVGGTCLFGREDIGVLVVGLQVLEVTIVFQRIAGSEGKDGESDIKNLFHIILFYRRENNRVELQINLRAGGSSRVHDDELHGVGSCFVEGNFFVESALIDTWERLCNLGIWGNKHLVVERFVIRCGIKFLRQIDKNLDESTFATRRSTHDTLFGKIGHVDGDAILALDECRSLHRNTAEITHIKHYAVVIEAILEV